MNKPTVAETIEYLQAEKLKQSPSHQGYYDVAIERIIVRCRDCSWSGTNPENGCLECGYASGEFFRKPRNYLDTCKDCDEICI